jgi:hypothetical protein
MVAYFHLQYTSEASTKEVGDAIVADGPASGVARIVAQRVVQFGYEFF